MVDENLRDETLEESEEVEEKPQEQYPLTWDLRDENNNIIDSDDGTVTLDSEKIRIVCKNSPPFDLRIEDISIVREENHKLIVILKDETSLILSKTRRLHDSLRENLMELWQSTIKRESLVSEKLICEFKNARARIIKAGSPPSNCTAAIYETAIVLLWESGDIVRIPFAFTGRPIEENWRFTFLLPEGSGYEIGWLGRNTDSFRESVNSAFQMLETKALEFINSLCRALTPIKARKLVPYFIDGRGTGKKDISNTSPALWKELENQIITSPLGPYWAKLSQLGNNDNARIGIKRGLAGGEGSEYTWFFIPIIHGDKGIVVMEATTGESQGRATYVFKNIPEDGEDILSSINRTMDILNYGLYMINFRREPIYLTDEQLNKAKYSHYLSSIKRIPVLRIIRELFLERIIHKNDGSWDKEVSALTEKYL